VAAKSQTESHRRSSIASREYERLGKEREKARDSISRTFIRRSGIHRFRLADFCADDLVYARVSLNNPLKPVICIATISAVCIEVTILGLFALLLNPPAAALSSRTTLRKKGLSLRTRKYSYRVSTLRVHKVKIFNAFRKTLIKYATGHVRYPNKLLA
jgi:hypothetical protein